MIENNSLADFNFLPIYPQSHFNFEGVEYGMVRSAEGKRLLVKTNAADKQADFEGHRQPFGTQTLILAPLTTHNAAVLRSRLTWLQPKLLGLRTSVGMGDRLGLATPGHIRALRSCQSKVAPVFAQQSIREMVRTGRTPQQVMDDATWGVFEENWQEGFGADADHLKTAQDIDACLAAGYTFFTIDPGEHVENRSEIWSLSDLKAMSENLPVQIRIDQNKLLDCSINIEHLHIRLDEETLLKAMVKYGHAVWHVAKMYQHLLEKAGQDHFELEVSVDETALPTSLAEHYYIASELTRLGVKWVSLAPRFVGKFEKGVDYIGDLDEFESDIAGHAAIARFCGPYKLSLHSGSDKFSIYSAAARHTKGLVHLKTAGTSYLEAIRTVASIDPHFFKEIYQFCLGRYEQDKLSYHVSARLDQAPRDLDSVDPISVLDQFDAREILHVTFGSVLTQKFADGTNQFYDRLIKLLENNHEVYAKYLEKHFIRHLNPICGINRSISKDG